MGLMDTFLFFVLFCLKFTSVTSKTGERVRIIKEKEKKKRESGGAI